jgi:hypothetical protein
MDLIAALLSVIAFVLLAIVLLVCASVMLQLRVSFAELVNPDARWGDGSHPVVSPPEVIAKTEPFLACYYEMLQRRPIADLPDSTMDLISSFPWRQDR